MPKTLLWRLGLALMVLQTIIVIAAGIYALASVRSFHFSQTEQQLAQLTSLFADDYLKLIEDAQPEALQDQVEADGVSAGIRITIVRDDGMVLADSEADPATMENHGNRAEIREAMQFGSGARVRFSDTVRRDMSYVARRVDRAGGRPVIIRCSRALTAINADFANIGRVMLITGVCSLAATLLAVYIVSRRLTQQVRAISDGASRYARGELDHRLASPPSAELADLVGSLNSMAAMLNQRLHELNEQRREEQAILRSMSSAVIALDLKERMLNINSAAERMLELDGNACRGRLLQEVVRQPELHELARQGLRDAHIETIEFTLRTTTPRKMQARCEPLRGANGATRGVLLILDDVTELRRLETIRSDFAANVSHELRTPITNLSGYVDTLLEIGLDDGERASRFLQIIKRNCDRLAAIVEDVLSLTQLEQPQQDLTIEREPVIIEGLVRSVVSQLTAAAAEKHIKLATEVQPGLRANWRRQLIEQALANLLDNAIKFSPPESQVTISAAMSGPNEISLSVADQGPGIPQEHLHRLFERFYRVDRARSRQLGGTGLGLAIVKHIALVHGGRVDVRSVVGEGSVFTISLPAMIAHSNESERSLSATQT